MQILGQIWMQFNMRVPLKVTVSGELKSLIFKRVCESCEYSSPSIVILVGSIEKFFAESIVLFLKVGR